MSENRTELMMYQTEDGQTKIDVRMENETVWLSLDQMAELFQRDKSTISGTSSPKANWIGRQLLQNLQQLPQTEKRIR